MRGAAIAAGLLLALCGHLAVAELLPDFASLPWRFQGILNCTVEEAAIQAASVGCGQGLHTATIMDIFAPELGVHRKSLHRALSRNNQDEEEEEEEEVQVVVQGAGRRKLLKKKIKQVISPQECPIDWAKVHTTPYLMNVDRSMDLHCIEFQDVKFAALDSVRMSMFPEMLRDEEFEKGGLRKGKNSRAALYLHHKVVSNQHGGQVSIARQCDSEFCGRKPILPGMKPVNTTERYILPVTTVDEILKTHGDPEHVALLKIDAGGFDPDVLIGTRQSLLRKVPLVIMFEYNKVNKWAKVQLKDVVTRFEHIGYSCFFEGSPHIFKLTNGCWDPKYEFHDWSNVVCGVANSKWERMLDAFSYLRQVKARAASSSF